MCLFLRLRASLPSAKCQGLKHTLHLEQLAPLAGTVIDKSPPAGRVAGKVPEGAEEKSANACRTGGVVAEGSFNYIINCFNYIIFLKMI